MMQKIHDTFGNVFNSIGCFEGTFSLQLKPDSKPYQVPPRHVAYALQKPFRRSWNTCKERTSSHPWEWTRQNDGVIALCWYPKQMIRMCLDPVQLNQALIRPLLRGLTLNDILPRLNNVQYMSIIDASSGYHNLKLHMQSSYLTTFACLFCRYRYKCLSIRAALAGNIFQCKINKIFNDMPNVFGIADDILVREYAKDGTDHDEAV